MDIDLATKSITFDRCISTMTGVPVLTICRRHYLALQGWHDVDFRTVFNLQSPTNKRRSTCRVYLLHLQRIEDGPFIRPESQLVYHSRETPICGVCRRMTLTSLRDGSKDLRIPNFGQLFHTQIEDDWEHEVSGLVLIYDLNVLIDTIFIELQNRLLYYCYPFHNPTSVECLGLDCKVEITNANQCIMPEFHNIWVLYMQS